MTSGFDVVKAVFEHRLHQTDIDLILKQLSSSAKSELLDKFAEMLERTSALVEVYNHVAETLSLDIVLPRLMQVVTEALHADRGTLFLYDREDGTLFSRIASGDGMGEIRFPAGAGIAGSVFRTGVAEIIPNAYEDPRFNQEIDRKTGYKTRNILCAPVRNKEHLVIGVTQVLNKQDGGAFSDDDRLFLEALTLQAASALENARLFDSIQKARREEAKLLEVTSAISSELQLDVLLERIIHVTTELLEADRSTLFLLDKKTGELWSLVAEGLETREIRIPAGAGIAGAAFTSGETLNIPEAYEDERFNKEVDRKTGYRTKSILCMPIRNKKGERLGVIQVLNRRGGPFSLADEQRLAAFTAQAAIALENAQLFEDVLNARNYNESILKSLSNGVISLDATGLVVKVNAAGARILGWDPTKVDARRAEELFKDGNAWVAASIVKVRESSNVDVTMDQELTRGGGETASVNLTTVPLIDINEEPIGTMLVFEDISNEKRVKSAMARYMTKEIVDQVMAQGDSLLGGKTQRVTILFSDIRKFTTLSEDLGARETVTLLNDYFTRMADVVFAHNGILDKYIGDAIMALFGSPFETPDDADNGVSVARDMIAALADFNAYRQAKGALPIDIGLGLATGDVVTGNIGSPKRMDYTAIGDSVNLASRLEGANKVYGTHALLDEATYNDLKTPHVLREMDLIRVKGKTKPVRIFEVVDTNGISDVTGLVEGFAAGIDAYRKRDWLKARQYFAECLSINPLDGPTLLYLERCNQLKRKPPPDSWDGVFEMTSK